MTRIDWEQIYQYTRNPVGRATIEPLCTKCKHFMGVVRCADENKELGEFAENMESLQVKYDNLVYSIVCRGNEHFRIKCKRYEPRQNNKEITAELYTAIDKIRGIINLLPDLETSMSKPAFEQLGYNLDCAHQSCTMAQTLLLVAALNGGVKK